MIAVSNYLEYFNGSIACVYEILKHIKTLIIILLVGFSSSVRYNFEL